MHWVLLLGLIATALSVPARANYYHFTGTFSLPDSSPGGSARFLPEGVGVSGSGVAYSRNAPPNRAIHGFGAVKGFTGALTTVLGSTGGYTQQVFLSGIGPGSFTTNTVGQPRLHGKLAVRGLAERLINGNRTAAFPLTAGGSKGLGLDGTLMASSGTFPSVRFGTWTTGTVVESNVIVETHPAMGSVVFGDLSAMGFDNRTPLGMGTVQFVTPIRTVGLLGMPGNRAAIGALTLTFAPEPGRAVLLLVACAALSLLGARRSRISA